MSDTSIRTVRTLTSRVRGVLLAAMSIACFGMLSVGCGGADPRVSNVQTDLLQAGGGGTRVQRVSINAGAPAIADIRINIPVTITTLTRIGNQVYALGGELAPIRPTHPPGLFELNAKGEARLVKNFTGYSNFGTGMVGVNGKLLIPTDNIIQIYDPLLGAFNVLAVPEGIAVDAKAGITADSTHVYFKTTDNRIAAVRFELSDPIEFVPASVEVIRILGAYDGHVLFAKAGGEASRVELPWAAASARTRIDQIILNAPGRALGIAVFAQASWLVSSPEFPTHYTRYERIETPGRLDIPNSKFRSAVELPSDWK